MPPSAKPLWRIAAVDSSGSERCSFVAGEQDDLDSVPVEGIRITQGKWNYKMTQKRGKYKDTRAVLEELSDVLRN